MNLITDPWLPVTRASGMRDWISPAQITEADDSPIALAAGRADFNGALLQFLIGLVQSAWMQAEDDWDRDWMLAHPPTSDELAARLEPLAPCFELDGDGPRFMQDFSLSDADKPSVNGIAALLIEAPAGNTLKENRDHFVKRDQVPLMCPDCAATALLTLQINAPSGGVGHRTSLRGGGPLTTLVVPRPSDEQPTTLWARVASNVMDAEVFEPGELGACGELHHRFPWLASQEKLQKPSKTAEVQPDGAHPLQHYWAMPRRIRLDFESTASGVCALCARETDRGLTQYQTKNYGLNYKGPWRHPLSPYQRSKETEPYLPMHPQPGGFTYRLWPAWVLGGGGTSTRRATVIDAFLRDRTSVRGFDLHAFGYDMDNMKARCWYEAQFPLFDLPESAAAQALFSHTVEAMVGAAQLACSALRQATRIAWSADGDYSMVDLQFWSQTESRFFAEIGALAALLRADDATSETTEPLRRGWAQYLGRCAREQFDQRVSSTRVEYGRPERLGQARRWLNKQLGWSERELGLPLVKALGLPAKTKGRERNKDEAET